MTKVTFQKIGPESWYVLVDGKNVATMVHYRWRGPNGTLDYGGGIQFYGEEYREWNTAYLQDAKREARYELERRGYH